jgi:ATP-dependent protease HslVU (ClpYQ) ATPase subunit
MEKVLEEVSYNASETPSIKVSIDAQFVRSNLGNQLLSSDLAKFIL